MGAVGCLTIMAYFSNVLMNNMLNNILLTLNELTMRLRKKSKDILRQIKMKTQPYKIYRVQQKQESLHEESL